jgi:hypothetical protein
MEFDELYSTHGNSACKAAETFRLRNRISYHGMVSGFGIFTGPASSRSRIRFRITPSFRCLTSLQLHGFVTNVTDWVGHIGLPAGDGTFQPLIEYPSGGSFPDSYPSSVALADLNGDAKPDVLVANFDPMYVVGVLLNNSGAPPTTTSLVSSVNPVTVKQVVTYTATVTPQSGGTLKGTEGSSMGTRRPQLCR